MADQGRAGGRPRVHGDRVTSAIRLTPGLHERLLAAAKERDISVNYLMSKAIEDYLDRLIPVEEVQWTRR